MASHCIHKRSHDRTRYLSLRRPQVRIYTISLRIQLFVPLIEEEGCKEQSSLRPPHSMNAQTFLHEKACSVVLDLRIHKGSKASI